MIHVKRLGEVGIVVRDLQGSLAWYQERLGFEHLFKVSNGVVIGRGHTHLWLAQAADPETAQPVDTAHDICQRLMSFEVSHDELQRVPGEFPEDDDIVAIDHPRYESYVVEDPDGHTIEFYAVKDVPGEPLLEERIVTLVDVAGFARLVRGRSEEEVFQMLDSFYREVEDLAGAAGGRALKYIGDGVLLSFPLDRAAAAVAYVESLPQELLSVWDDYGTTCKVHVKADVLSLAWGHMGRMGSFDAIGDGLNQLFMHVSDGRSISAALWELAQEQADHTDGTTSV